MPGSRENDNQLGETVGVQRIGNLRFPSDDFQGFPGSQKDIFGIEIELGVLLVIRGHDNIVLVIGNPVKVSPGNSP